jgi:ribosome-associated protein
MNEEIMSEVTSLEGATAAEVAKVIAEVLDAKKGRDVKIIHVEEKTVIAEYFVLCTGNSSTQVKGLVGEVEYQLERRGIKPYNVEGRDNNSWILIDYSNVIVHVFSREAREFYNLDKLYGDSSAVSVSTED